MPGMWPAMSTSIASEGDGAPIRGRSWTVRDASSTTLQWTALGRTRGTSDVAQKDPSNSYGGGRLPACNIVRRCHRLEWACRRRARATAPRVQDFRTGSSMHNGDRRRPVCGPGCACRVRAMQSRGTARGFAQRYLAIFFGKANAVHRNRLSDGATRLKPKSVDSVDCSSFLAVSCVVRC